MNSRKQPVPNLGYTAISIATFLALQSLIVVVHEFTHSTMAWTLGDMKTPLGIVWGNPLTMTGWDEGVEYEHLFAQGRSIQAAIIGFCPLVMHSIVVTIGILLLRGQWLYQKRWGFNAVYWLVVGNLMELIAYFWMRSFSGHGDVGLFCRGTGVSPWWAFIIGSTLLAWVILLFYRTVLPRLQALFAPDNPPTQWAILILTSFILFLWGSGIRVMVYVTGPQWMFGILGVLAFLLTVACFIRNAGRHDPLPMPP